MRNLFNSWVALTGIILIISWSGCKPPPPPPEESLRISTDAGTFITLPGPEFDFNLIVESAMPKAGVQIEFKVTGESNGVSFPQGPAITTSSKNTKIKIQNLPAQILCICEITVISVGKRTNSARTSFRVVYK